MKVPRISDPSVYVEVPFIDKGCVTGDGVFISCFFINGEWLENKYKEPLPLSMYKLAISHRRFNCDAEALKKYDLNLREAILDD